MTQDRRSGLALAPAEPHPAAAHSNGGSAYAWYVVLLLTAALTISLIDRNILGLMIAPVKRDLDLNEFEVGLLLGAAFALFYTVLGAPMGWLADHYDRRRLIGAGMMLWCVMTSLCGLANSFGSLFIVRLGVGVGEAALMPAALSLISDYFPPERRGKAISLLMSGALLGTASAYFLGGPLVEFVSTTPHVDIPILGPVKPWQAVFMIVGLPGLLMAFVVLTIREPIRHGRVLAAETNSFRETVSYFVRERRVYGKLFSSFACGILLGYTALWTAALYERTWHWPIGRIGITMGVIILCAALPGTTLAGWLTDRWRARGVVDAPRRAALVGAVLMLPGYVLFPLMPSGEAALPLLYLAIFGQAMLTAAGPSTVINLAPPSVRAQATSLYLICNGIAGMLIGPACVGLITDTLGSPHLLRYSLAIVGLVFGLATVALLALLRRDYETAVAESATSR